MSKPLAVVLAAGKGTRMKTDLPKVLVPCCGRPLIEYVLDALRAGGVGRALVVVGYGADQVRHALHGRANITFVEQTPQLGTGHAVAVCRPHLVAHRGAVVVVTGDSPMTQGDSIAKLLDLYDREHPACILGTLNKEDPRGLGRVVRDEHGEFLAIVEEKDATDQQRKITEVNMSTYVFDCPLLLSALDRLNNDNQQGEFYITDCPGILKREGRDVRALAVLKPWEAMSVNSWEELQLVEAEMRRW
jgi:bifunctional UDP-N-acetylglucosamine pyrophosphorylase/glucosamine-1-phosphate N-acetyltransferase/UDP-N-acetylglucosamine pyrophosphorylase